MGWNSGNQTWSGLRHLCLVTLKTEFSPIATVCWDEAWTFGGTWVHSSYASELSRRGHIKGEERGHEEPTKEGLQLSQGLQLRNGSLVPAEGWRELWDA